MGTLARVVIYAPASGLAKEAMQAAFERIHELDCILSDYKPDSELNRLCRSRPGVMVPISGDLFTVLDHASRLAGQTGGAFDVTVGPLTHLWRAARRQRRMPGLDEIEAARLRTGFRKLTIDLDSRSAALATGGMRLDLGGLAKGYAAGAARDVLRNLGMNRSMVAISGDICLGNPPPDQASGWRIGIRSAATVAHLDNICVSTSGDSEQYLEIGGVRYSHILDPRAGFRLRAELPITVAAPEGILADSLATALSVLGPQERQRLLELYPAARLLY